MFRWVQPLVAGRRGGRVVFECRRCGTTLDSGTAPCPYCGPTDVARFVVE